MKTRALTSNPRAGLLFAAALFSTAATYADGAAVARAGADGARPRDATVAASSSAAGQTGEPEYRWLFRGDVGWASPVGLAGFTFAHQHTQWMRTELGVGGGAGFQVSLMPVFSFGGENHKFIGGAGLSGGIHTTYTLYLNVDVAGYEYNAEGGFVFSVSGGFTMPIAWNDRGAPVIEPYIPYPQIRVGFGIRF